MLAFRLLTSKRRLAFSRRLEWFMSKPEAHTTSKPTSKVPQGQVLSMLSAEVLKWLSQGVDWSILRRCWVSLIE